MEALIQGCRPRVSAWPPHIHSGTLAPVPAGGCFWAASPEGQLCLLNARLAQEGNWHRGPALFHFISQVCPYRGPDGKGNVLGL